MVIDPVAARPTPASPKEWAPSRPGRRRSHQGRAKAIPQALAVRRDDMLHQVAHLLGHRHASLGGVLAGGCRAVDPCDGLVHPFDGVIHPVHGPFHPPYSPIHPIEDLDGIAMPEPDHADQGRGPKPRRPRPRSGGRLW
jgi:hypothetical protein